MNTSTEGGKKVTDDKLRALEAGAISPDALHHHETYYETILWSLAHIAHACEKQSRDLASSHNLTGLELACLRRVVTAEGATIDELVQRSPLSRETLIEVHERLGARRLVVVHKRDPDSGSLFVEPTVEGKNVALSAAPPIHERFAEALMDLEEDEQRAIADSFRTVVEMIERERER